MASGLGVALVRGFGDVLEGPLNLADCRHQVLLVLGEIVWWLESVDVLLDVAQLLGVLLNSSASCWSLLPLAPWIELPTSSPRPTSFWLSGGKSCLYLSSALSPQAAGANAPRATTSRISRRLTARHTSGEDSPRRRGRVKLEHSR